MFSRYGHPSPHSNQYTAITACYTIIFPLLKNKLFEYMLNSHKIDLHYLRKLYVAVHGSSAEPAAPATESSEASTEPASLLREILPRNITSSCCEWRIPIQRSLDVPCSGQSGKSCDRCVRVRHQGSNFHAGKNDQHGVYNTSRVFTSGIGILVDIGNYDDQG